MIDHESTRTHLTRERIAEIRKKEEAATKGPWFTVGPPWLPRDCPTWINAGSDDPHIGTAICEPIEILEWPSDQDGPDYSQAERDMEYIAHSRQDIPDLLAELDLRETELTAAAARIESLEAEARGLREEIATLRGDVEHYAEVIRASAISALHSGERLEVLIGKRETGQSALADADTREGGTE